MALALDYEYSTKKGSYWKVIGIYLDYTYTQTNVKVALYRTKEDRFHDESSYIKTFKFALDGIIPSKDKVYEALKLKPQFNNCKDV